MCACAQLPDLQLRQTSKHLNGCGVSRIFGLEGLLVLDIYVLFVIALATSAVELRMRLQPHTDIFGETNVDKSQ